jgi:osmoprotectant transport system permease protein
METAMGKHKIRWILTFVFSGMFILLISDDNLVSAALRFLFPGISQVMYPGNSLLSLLGRHLELVAISSSATILVGGFLGIWVTRRSGKNFQPLVNDIASIGQTFPPVAVLALAVPLFGFGIVPTIIALFFYGLFPVIRNTIAGINSVPAEILESSSGMGLNRLQTLFRVEIPVGARIIISGIRISIIINIGTAMIGAVIGAGGLGSPVIAGLVEFNLAYTLEGVVPAAILAILVNQLLENVEATFVKV